MASTSVSYQCPNCGAPIGFSPGKAKVTCEYCNTEFETKAIEALFAGKEEQAKAASEAEQAKWDTADAGSDWGEDASLLRVQTCSACGAELVSDENTMATECAYCGSPNLAPTQYSGGLKPDYVIPFKKTKEEAKAALKEFYKGKRLLPSGFLSENRLKEIQAMYVPFWLFDSSVFARATFRAEKVDRRETSDEIITTTRTYECERSGSMEFNRIPVDGSERMDDTFMESIEPFDYGEMQEFSSAYLTGFLADKYDVDAEAAVPRADERVNRSALGVLEDTVEGYDTVRLEGEPAVIKQDASVKYAMVPVWILTTKYQGQPYTFMMNGQTGKVVGSLPIDYRKAWMYTLVTGIIALPIAYFIAKFMLA